MHDQVSAVTEALPTLPTHIGPFPSVDHLVVGEVGSLPEALSTFPTLIRLFVCVDHLVTD